MSGTRNARAGAPIRQERYCSSSEYPSGLKALPVAQRTELLYDREWKSLIWFLQFRSLARREEGIGRLGGIENVATELFPAFSSDLRERGVITRGELDASGKKVEQPHRPANFDAEWGEAVYQALVAFLIDLCVNPQLPEAFHVNQFTSSRVEHGFLSLASVRQTLREYRQSVVDLGSCCIAETAVHTELRMMLEFTFETGRPTLSEGNPRTGRTSTAKAFCETHPGEARYVLSPPGTAERDLYRAVADALGVADGASYTNAQIREKAEEVLRRSRHMLVFDEAQRLLPPHKRIQSIPQRMIWIHQLIDWGVPVAFVALPTFSKLLKRVGEQTDWPIEQITGRVSYLRLPEQLTEEDLRAIVRKRLPMADAKTTNLVVGCAMQDNDQAGAIAKVADLACFLAHRRGLLGPELQDFTTAVLKHHGPSSAMLATAVAPSIPRQGSGGPAAGSRPGRGVRAAQSQPDIPGMVWSGTESPANRLNLGFKMPTP